MSGIFCGLIGSTCLLASTLTHAGCSQTFTENLIRTQHLVDSIRPDKAGQVRVFASDGSEFTAGQALWMKGQLRSALKACELGDENSAASALYRVAELVNSHPR